MEGFTPACVPHRCELPQSYWGDIAKKIVGHDIDWVAVATASDWLLTAGTWVLMKTQAGWIRRTFLGSRRLSSRAPSPHGELSRVQLKGQAPPWIQGRSCSSQSTPLCVFRLFELHRTHSQRLARLLMVNQWSQESLGCVCRYLGAEPK